MNLAAPEDAASVLEQFMHDIANTSAENTHLMEEIQAKDMQILAFKDEINKRDAQLQKWVRLNGGHVQNPKEEAFTRTINDCYDKCEILQAEKCGLSERANLLVERQTRRLDVGLRGLSLREEFPTDWNGPSLLSGSGSVTGVSTPVTGGGGAVQPLQVVSGNIGSVGGAPNIANAAQMRMAQQAAAASGRAGAHIGGIQTPSSMPRSQREGSSEANKKRRLNVNLGNVLAASSNLRQSSLGPGTPKAGTPVPTVAGTSRAGSAQPARPTAGQKKAPTTAAGRKLAPPPAASGRKRDRNRRKADRRRHLKGDRATPSTNASVSDEDESASPTPSSLPRSQADGAGAGDRRRPHASEDEDEEDETEDDNSLYCTCRNKSHGEMIACDNDNCKFQWFHYGCVGIKQQPVGEWLCEDCRKLPRSKIVKESQ